jgi:hypothetical protein
MMFAGYQVLEFILFGFLTIVKWWITLTLQHFSVVTPGRASYQLLLMIKRKIAFGWWINWYSGWTRLSSF